MSGLAAAALALLPALVAGLIALFDLSAHALLGTSGSLLGFAGSLLPVGGDGGALPPYARIDVHPWLAALASLARGVPPVAMVGAALRPRRSAAGQAAPRSASSWCWRWCPTARRARSRPHPGLLAAALI